LKVDEDITDIPHQESGQTLVKMLMPLMPFDPSRSAME
jgi:hypothetical protein